MKSNSIETSSKICRRTILKFFSGLFVGFNLKNTFAFIKSSKKIGLFFWKVGDIKVIDKFGPDGISSLIKELSLRASKFQSGFIYQYAFMILIGFSALLTFLILK